MYQLFVLQNKFHFPFVAVRIKHEKLCFASDLLWHYVLVISRPGQSAPLPHRPLQRRQAQMARDNANSHKINDVAQT